VSHRVLHNVNTGFHQETIYSREMEHDGKKCVHIRRTLGKNLNKNEIFDIVDERVREAVVTKIRVLGFDPDNISDGDWKKISKAFLEFENLPYLMSKSGRFIPVKKVRVRTTARVMAIGSNGRERNVLSGSNSHIEIFEVTDTTGRTKWEGIPVTRFEAMQRLREGKAIVNKTGKNDSWKFKFSLAGGDIVEMDTADSKQVLFVVRTVSLKTSGYHEIEYTGIASAGLKADLRKNKQWFSAAINPLKQKNCRKVNISPLGDIHYVND
jgi:hypothetical protein